MKLRVSVLLVILLLAPFLSAPVFHACPMEPEVPAAACCCGGEEANRSSCCTIVTLPHGDRLSGPTTSLTPPELQLVASPWPLRDAELPQTPALVSHDHPWRRPPQPPLYLLQGSFLS